MAEMFDSNGKEKRVPIGQLVQSLRETVEVQAVHISKLNNQLKEMKAQIQALSSL